MTHRRIETLGCIDSDPGPGAAGGLNRSRFALAGHAAALHGKGAHNDITMVETFKEGVSIHTA